jgi:predicted aspartyl protease
VCALNALGVTACTPVGRSLDPVRAPIGRHSVAVQRSDYQLIFVSVEVNGRSTLALLDSGGSTGIQLASSLVSQLSLTLQDTADQRTRLDTSVRRRQTGTLTSFALGDYHVGPVTFDALEGDVERIAQQVGTPFEVILGWKFLEQFYSVLDYPKARLEFDEPASQAPPPDTRVAFSIDSVSGVPLVSGQLGSVHVRFVLDTGAPVSTLDNELANSLAPPVGRSEVVLRGQRVPLDVREVVVGDQALQIGFLGKDLGTLKPIGARGVLGTSFLGQYRLTLDPLAQRAYLS